MGELVSVFLNRANLVSDYFGYLLASAIKLFIASNEIGCASLGAAYPIRRAKGEVSLILL